MSSGRSRREAIHGRRDDTRVSSTGWLASRARCAGLQRMIEEGKDCEQILAQLAAVKSALDRVGTHLISHRMKDCLRGSRPASELDPVALEKAFDMFFKYVQCMRSIDLVAAARRACNRWIAGSC